MNHKSNNFIFVANLLTRRIPKSQIDRFPVDHYVRRIIIENSWNIFARKSIRGVTDQKARFTDSTETKFVFIEAFL